MLAEIRCDLISLVAVLVLRFAFEAVCPIHVLRLVIPAVDEHPLRI